MELTIHIRQAVLYLTVNIVGRSGAIIIVNAHTIKISKGFTIDIGFNIVKEVPTITV
jgi:hypothetical protein